MSNRIGFVSLGCPKALVDSERIMTTLIREGYELVDAYEEADLVIINTCGFITEAEEESLEAIGEAIREQGRVIVTGCLGARPEKIRQHFNEVLAITGPAKFDELIQAVHQQLPPPNKVRHSKAMAEVRLTPPHYAYLKISEGCSHHCSFCIIPQLRGAQVSRTQADIIQQAQRLIDDGAQELIVIAQDTAAYGLDGGNRDGGKQQLELPPIVKLCHALGDLGVWIRLHYLYPQPVIDELVWLMADGKLLPYLDVPFQHSVPAILKQMCRPGNYENMLEDIQRWRKICPDLAIRSTFIVGFPGESEEDSDALLEFIYAAQLDRVGAFKYSPVDGAAANAFADQVDEGEKQDRLERLMLIQESISRHRLAERVGKLEQVIVDEIISSNEAVGRSRGDAPEIDGVVNIKSRKILEPGNLVTVRITHSDEHDLWGTVE